MRALAIGGFLTALLLFAAVEWAARREGSRIPSLADVCAFVMRYEVGPVPDVNWFQQRLAQVGYQTPRTGEFDVATREVISTFQMKYRPANFAGDMDAETAALLEVVTTPGGMLMKQPRAADSQVRSAY